jgi:hypothetical protein
MSTPIYNMKNMVGQVEGYHLSQGTWQSCGAKSVSTPRVKMVVNVKKTEA